MRELGDRMKSNYEDRQRFYLARRTPVIIRIDGRAFHTFTRDFDKPFDMHLLTSMVNSAWHVFNEMQGCKLAYVQSDEASFVLTDYDTFTTEACFDYNKSKLESIAASVMTAAFGRYMRASGVNRLAYFDARAFNIPEAEVVNYFLWRAKDWHRNSVAMFAQANFSHSELQGKSITDMHEMLRTRNLVWATTLADVEKNGTFLYRLFNNDDRSIAKQPQRFQARTDIEPCYNLIADLWEEVRPVCQT